MNKNAKKWVKVLRSEKYKQTKKVLKDEKGYCCLGVACDLYGKEKNINWEIDAFLNQRTYLPVDVRDWLGLNTNGGGYKGGVLANANDIGKSFKEIADIIELEPEGLFVK